MKQLACLAISIFLAPGTLFGTNEAYASRDPVTSAILELKCRALQTTASHFLDTLVRLKSIEFGPALCKMTPDLGFIIDEPTF